MFHPEVIARRERAITRQYQSAIPGGKLVRRSLDECWAMRDQLARVLNEKGQPKRPVTDREQAFIFHEQLLQKIDYLHWSSRWAVIAKDTSEAAPLTPRWASQQLFLDHIAALEYARLKDGHPDGLLFNVLKARQLGVSTETEVILAHAMVTETSVRGLVAGDVREQSEYLFGMAELVIDSLPWWIKPPTEAHRAGTIWKSATGASIRTAWGRSARGGLQEREKAKGNIGRGKSQPLTAKILTPTGWTTMGAIRPGDDVIGSDGRPTRVLAIHPQGILPIFRVTFSDGSSTECSADHLWAVRSAQGRHRGFRPHVLPLARLRDTLTWRGIRRRFIPITAPVEFAPCAPLPLDPYLLGVLIGDGCLTQSCGLSTADAELLGFVSALLPIGWRLTYRRQYDWAITAPLQAKRSPLLTILTTLGLRGKRAHEKRIPSLYLRASRGDRQRLLQGLIDTDGWVTPDRVEYCTVSPALAEDVTFLVQSLGGVVRQRSRVPKGGRRAYTLSICLPGEIVPCRLTRKLAKLNRRRKYFPARAMTKIEPAGEAEAQCISVAAPDGLYLTDGCIVTHNTYSKVHLSELSTWERPEQIDDGLLPGVPVRARTFVVFESTAKGRYDWWHQHWLQAERGTSRFANIFIPWYIEPDKYWLPPPAGWQPLPTTLAHAEEVERDSPRWCLGKTVRLTKPQLYWYEQTRRTYDDDAQGPEFTTDGRRVATFYEEYPASPRDAFQHAGVSIFSQGVLDRLKTQERPPSVILVVEPAKDIALLRAWERQQAAKAAAEVKADA